MAVEPGSADIPPFSTSFHQDDCHRSRVEQMTPNHDLSFSQSTPLPSNSMPPPLDRSGGHSSASDCNIRSPSHTIPAGFSTAEQEDNRPLTLSDPNHPNAMSCGLRPEFVHAGSLATPSVTAQSPQSLIANQSSRYESEMAPPSYHTNPSQTPTTTPDEKQEVSSVYNGETVGG